MAKTITQTIPPRILLDAPTEETLLNLCLHETTDIAHAAETLLRTAYAYRTYAIAAASTK